MASLLWLRRGGGGWMAGAPEGEALGGGGAARQAPLQVRGSFIMLGAPALFQSMEHVSAKMNASAHAGANCSSRHGKEHQVQALRGARISPEARRCRVPNILCKSGSNVGAGARPGAAGGAGGPLWPAGAWAAAGGGAGGCAGSPAGCRLPSMLLFFLCDGMKSAHRQGTPSVPCSASGAALRMACSSHEQPTSSITQGSCALQLTAPCLLCIQGGRMRPPMKNVKALCA